ncbi:hypothetical protein BJ742DRAFT_777733 [Cladochytrium replicatum]|nr:hypothetical protein BJ742DRAFT_777733 [Cladochytrium replicatum]
MFTAYIDALLHIPVSNIPHVFSVLKVSDDLRPNFVSLQKGKLKGLEAPVDLVETAADAGLNPYLAFNLLENLFFNVCVQYAEKEVILTINEDRTIASLEKELRNECDIGDVDFALYALLDGSRKRLKYNEDVEAMVNGRMFGSSRKSPTLVVELIGSTTLVPITPPRTNPATPIASLTSSASSQFPAGETFDLMLSYQ